MMISKISIVTVAYNSEKTIRNTIESVLNQSVSPYEYIIVDGLSKDQTLSIIESYRLLFEKKGIRYDVISEKDNGIYDAMNKGIYRTSGEIVGMINSDDWYNENAVQTVAETYANTNFDMFYADLQIVKKTGDFLKRARFRKIATSRDWNHPTTFVKKKLYELMDYDCSEFYADFDFYLKVRKAGFKIVVVNEVLANFRFGGVSNSKNISQVFFRIKTKYRLYRKHGYSQLYMLDCLIIEILKYIL